MTSIYLVRHAHAQGNLEQRFQGRTDLPLTEDGHRQVVRLVRRMRAIPLSAVYSSPLQRAMDTARPVAESHGLEVIPCEGLSEIDGGAMENVTFVDLERLYPEETHNFTNRPHLFDGVGGGESIQAVYDRASVAIMELVRANRGTTILAVSHGVAARCILCYAMGLPISRMDELGWGKNTSVSHITFDQALRPMVHSIFDDSHLYHEIRPVSEGPGPMQEETE